MRFVGFLATVALAWRSCATALHVPSSSAKTSSSSRNPLYRIRGGTQLKLSPEAVLLAETLAPKIGIATSTALYFAPAAAVLNAIKSDDKGDLNPLPLAIMATSSVAWLAYGLAARDPFVTLSNIAGAVASIGYVVGILPLLRERKQLRQTQSVAMAGAAVSLGLWTFLGLTSTSAAKMSSTLGIFASALFIVLSGSPLSTIRTVVRTRNSSSILGPFMAAQCVNTFLWSTYGLAVKDRYVHIEKSILANVHFSCDRLRITRHPTTSYCSGFLFWNIFT